VEATFRHEVKTEYGATLDNNIPSPKSSLGDNICAMPITIETSLKAIQKERKQTEKEVPESNNLGMKLTGCRVHASIATAIHCKDHVSLPLHWNCALPFWEFRVAIISYSAILSHLLYQVTCIVFFDVHCLSLYVVWVKSNALGEKFVKSNVLVEMEKTALIGDQIIVVIIDLEVISILVVPKNQEQWQMIFVIHPCFNLFSNCE
jgi:hypothetical protein